MSKLTEAEMMKMMESANSAVTGDTTTPVEEVADGIAPLTVRRLMIIGCGDGGCNIATAVARKIPDETFVVAYNTSKRNVNEIVCDMKVYVTSDENSHIVDGSGKSRAYSKDAFKLNAYKNLLETVQVGLEKMPDISYIVVCTTTDGGTGSGSSPMVAKLLSDNTDVPVLLMGVYPSMSEDATAQYNALEWQSEVERIGVPYFVLDNNQPGMKKPQVHSAVNNMGAMIASLLAGKEFGNSPISIIDNRNLYMLLVQMGGRLVAAIDDARPSAGQSLDEYVMAMLQKNYQPEPSNVRGIGVFIKGSQELLDKMDTSIPEVQKKYGNAVLHFAHIETSDTVEIAVLLTGCSEAAGRLMEMKNRYDDIIHAQKEATSVIGDVMSGMKNPLGDSRMGKRREGVEPDISALDL